MKKTIFLVLLLFISFFGLVGCEKPAGPDDIVAISISEKYLPEKLEKTQVLKFIDDLGVTLHFGDGSTEIIDFTREMISDEDYLSLFEIGIHTVSISYLELTTQITVEVYEKVDEFFTVKVVYPDGTPVEAGVVVKWIRASGFARTTSVEEDGTAQILKEDYEYTIHLENLPVGYTYNPNIYKVDNEVTYSEITLLYISEYLEGTGSKNDPYAINKGTYKVYVERETIIGMKVFAFQVFETGTYYIESLSMEKYSDNKVDPYIGFLGTTIDFSNADYSGNLESYVNINFKHEFQGVAGEVYYFFVFASMAMEFPTYFYINIYK